MTDKLALDAYNVQHLREELKAISSRALVNPFEEPSLPPMFTDLSDEDNEKMNQEIANRTREFNPGDLVEVTFIGEVTAYDATTDQYEILLPYNFLSGRYNHAEFASEDLKEHVVPYEDGAVYKDGVGELYLRKNDSWYSFGSDLAFDDGVFAWDKPVMVLDSSGCPV